MWRSVGIARQRSALNSLSDHMLKDIGLSRSDIESITANLADGCTDTVRRRYGR